MARVITVTLNPCMDKTIILEGFEPGRVNRASGTVFDAGGKGINVSRALVSFGVENRAIGILGRKNGQLLKQRLAEEGVTADFCEVQGETRTNYKIFDKKSGATTDINEPGIMLTKDNIEEFIGLYKESITDADYVVLAGSIPPGMSCDIYRRLIGLANEIGVRVILDASGEALAEGIKEKPFAIKPNIHELEELSGRKLKSISDILEAIRQIQQAGVELAVVSMGEDGAIFALGDIAYQTGTLETEVKSTVGCGDSVVAGMVYSLVNGFDLEKTAMIASAAGGVTAGKQGTSMCELDEVLAVYGDIGAERIQFL